MDSEFVSINEAARQLNLSRMLLSRRIRSGELDAYEDPRDRQALVRTTDLEALQTIRPMRHPRPAHVKTAARAA